jgi:predicted lysophospholipase L1 biosynthesis ABC-type transport system permease subunit
MANGLKDCEWRMANSEWRTGSEGLLRQAAMLCLAFAALIVAVNDAVG